MALGQYRFLLLSLVINISVGYAKPPRKIVNGTEASNIPYQVSIRGRSHMCGGSIIDKRHILTAAHCYPAVTVLVGTNDKNNLDDKNIYHVVDTISHPEYNLQKFMNDIAILTLDRDIIFNEYRKPISLPDKEIAVDTPVNFSGWGYTQEGGLYRGWSPRYLQTATGKIMDQLDCIVSLNLSRPIIHDRHVCVSTGGQSTPCRYDSGGPLVHGSVLVGITSFAKGNCESKYPSVFVRVYPYAPWIRQVLNETQIVLSEPSTNSSNSL